MDRSLKAAVDMDVCTQLHEDAGHAGILTDGQIFFFRRREVRPEQVKGVLCQRPGLFGRALSSASCTSRGRRVLASMQRRATVSVICCAEMVLIGAPSVYRRATPLSRAAFATAFATASATRGSKAPGMMFSSLRSSSVMRSAMA